MASYVSIPQNLSLPVSIVCLSVSPLSPMISIGFCLFLGAFCFSEVCLFVCLFSCFLLDLCLSSSVRVGESLWPSLSLAPSLCLSASLCICLCLSVSLFLSVFSISVISLCLCQPLSAFVSVSFYHPLAGVGGGRRGTHLDLLSGDEDSQGDLCGKQEQQCPKILGRGRVERSG